MAAASTTDGDWRDLYAMAFLDSHSKVEPIAGYGFLKIGQVSAKTSPGAQATTAFLTTRHDIMSYAVPGILPAEFRLQRRATYIPG